MCRKCMQTIASAPHNLNQCGWDNVYKTDIWHFFFLDFSAVLLQHLPSSFGVADCVFLAVGIPWISIPKHSNAIKQISLANFIFVPVDWPYSKSIYVFERGTIELWLFLNAKHKWKTQTNEEIDQSLSILLNARDFFSMYDESPTIFVWIMYGKIVKTSASEYNKLHWTRVLLPISVLFSLDKATPFCCCCNRHNICSVFLSYRFIDPRLLLFNTFQKRINKTNSRFFCKCETKVDSVWTWSFYQKIITKFSIVKYADSIGSFLNNFIRIFLTNFRIQCNRWFGIRSIISHLHAHANQWREKNL